jgi:hypothetical protein
MVLILKKGRNMRNSNEIVEMENLVWRPTQDLTDEESMYQNILIFSTISKISESN